MSVTSNLIRHGGKILVDQLKIQGCSRVFLVPGESYLPVLDGLHDANDIDVIVCRQEGGAAIMAEAHGKLTNDVGVCMVTRGPGATNASCGVHIAHQDSTPMILFIGQVDSSMTDREAFQEVDYRQMFGPLAKWVAEINDIERIPEYISRAYHVAKSGRPGPVVLALPENVLFNTAAVADAKIAVNVEAKATIEDSNSMLALLNKAERPIVIVGGGGWTAQASNDLVTFTEKTGVPVATSFRCQDYIDNSHSHYIGDVGIGVNPKLAESIKTADLIVLIGSRMGEMTSSGYTLLDIPNPTQKLIHVFSDSDELGSVYRPDLAINASQKSLLNLLSGMSLEFNTQWESWRKQLREDYEAFHQPVLTVPGNANFSIIVSELSKQLPSNAIITNGAGNYCAFVHRFYSYKDYRTQLAPTSGSMGYGLPAAVAAKLEKPDVPVVCFAGDGCFLMHGQELATAAQYNAAIIVVVINNGMYGTIRMHQERSYPERRVGTDLQNPDFVALAKAYGGYAELVEHTNDFEAAFERAKKQQCFSLIELKVDPEALTANASLSKIIKDSIEKLSN
ncbi:thiamine pyrophosphate protein [Marinomonas ushuaiensis DSM 15871]|uniref:Thiamine pyrophosphate protein n=1 Tax=Marinomonas ushuaiensis DSM 15871 TaxID=1122207 RepID=X7E8U3_9GAMM|nr:thiamine pyrophosphate-binding protein [Marinomonas ushuaiensis]ETX12362.1 thiamine pyrophosphate protein [Marinomonas ushuaiensis DSM 15871]